MREEPENKNTEKDMNVSCKKKVYEKPKMEKHEPLEESTAYVYYYYRIV